MSKRAQRERIAACLRELDWATKNRLWLIHGEASIQTLSGLLRKAFAPELARCVEVEETLARVRKVVGRKSMDETVTVRSILAALYGEE